MTAPTPLPSAQRPLTAAEKQKADGIKANYVKEGRAAERRDWQVGLGVGSIEEARELAYLREQLKKRPTERETGKHGGLKYWQGMVIGGAFGLAIAGVFFAVAMWATVQQMTDVFNRATVNGMVMATQPHAGACVPNQPLADGSRCPQPVQP